MTAREYRIASRYASAVRRYAGGEFTNRTLACWEHGWRRALLNTLAPGEIHEVCRYQDRYYNVLNDLRAQATAKCMANLKELIHAG